MNVIKLKEKELFILIMCLIVFLLFSFKNSSQNTISLSEIIKIALVNNPEMKSLTFDITKAKNALDDAESGIYIPNIIAKIGFYSYPSITDNVTINYTLALSKILFNGLSLITQRDVARLNYDYQKSKYEIAWIEIQKNIFENYYTILLYEKLLEVLLHEKETLKMQQEAAIAFFQQGIISEINLISAKTSYNKILPEISKAENKISASKISLSNLVGYDIHEKFKFIGSFEDLKKIITILDSSEMQGNDFINYDSKLLEIKTKISIAKKEIEAYDLSLLPSLDINAEVSYDSTSTNPVYSIGIDIVFDIDKLFFLTLGLPKRELLNNELEKLLHQEKTLIKTVNNDIKIKQMETKQYRLQLQYLDENLSLIKRGLDIINAEYKLGKRTMIEVSEWRDTYLQESEKYWTTLRNYAVNVITLLYQSGKTDVVDLLEN